MAVGVCIGNANTWGLQCVEGMSKFVDNVFTKSWHHAQRIGPHVLQKRPRLISNFPAKK